MARPRPAKGRYRGTVHGGRPDRETGGPAGNRDLAHDADLVISIGCRLSDFTTASKTAFQDPAVRFVGINVVEMDAFKHAAIPW